MADGWLRVAVKRPPGERADLLLEGLLAAGGSAVEETGDRYVTYLPLRADREAVLHRLRTALIPLLGPEPPELELEDVPEQDWIALWRAGLGARRVGSRIVVAPTWAAADAADHEIVVRIDPQMAFGTGEHASTRGVLRLMEPVVRPGSRVLDVGTGSAILAIAAALLDASHVFAVESDPDAIPNAAENVALNGVTQRVTLQCRVADDAFFEGHGAAAFDGILANVLSSVLRPLLPAFHRALVPGGWVILAGILAEEAAELRAAAVATGFAVEAEDSEEQWWSVLLRRAS
jgi:ribosomal protein L11 methyltransferase